MVQTFVMISTSSINLCLVMRLVLVQLLHQLLLFFKMLLTSKIPGLLVNFIENSSFTLQIGNFGLSWNFYFQLWILIFILQNPHFVTNINIFCQLRRPSKKHSFLLPSIWVSWLLYVGVSLGTFRLPSILIRAVIASNQSFQYSWLVPDFVDMQTSFCLPFGNVLQSAPWCVSLKTVGKVLFASF